MSHRLKQAGRTVTSIGQFFTSAADSIKRARQAQEFMRKPDIFFESRGTTRERMIRGVFEL